MMLIADSGSTKTSWCLLEEDKETYFNTEGYNPYFVTSDYMINSIQCNLLTHLNIDSITDIYFYGAGYSEDKSEIIKKALRSIFKNAKANVEMDLLAAARALLGTQSGFAAILGTGTNTCIYNGSKIVQNIDSLGFILGDEGSGGSMGKKLLSDYIRDEMPRNLHKIFKDTYALTSDEIIDQIYTKPMPNRFCANFSRFLFNNLNEGYILNLVETAFCEFFKNLVSKYPCYQDYKFNCIGSIAYNFKDILEDTARKFDMLPGKIIMNPISGLVDYHKTMNNL